MLEESRDRIVALHHALRERGAAEFDHLVESRSYCIYEKAHRGPVEQVFDLVFRRQRDLAEIQLRMPPPGEELEVVLDDEVRRLIEVDLQDPVHLTCDGYHMDTVAELADEVMEQARLALEE